MGKTGDLTFVINRRRRVPRHAAEVADVGRCSVLPDHGVSSAEPAYGAITNAGDANHRTLIIDGGGRRGSIAGDGGKFLDLAVLRSPHDGAELQHLSWRNAGWVMEWVLGPSYGLSPAVNRSSVSVAD